MNNNIYIIELKNEIDFPPPDTIHRFRTALLNDSGKFVYMDGYFPKEIDKHDLVSWRKV